MLDGVSHSTSITLNNGLDSPPTQTEQNTIQKALRPICLQHPVNKAFAGIQCQLILAQTFPTLRQLPLYAYLPSRGTRDCLLIVASHCRQVRDTCSQFRSSPNAPGMQGGLQISLDMEKAFDTVARSKVLQALDPYHFDVDVLRMIHS